MNKYITVKVLKTPISERYCREGDTAEIDFQTNRIRCGGVWFTLTEQHAGLQYEIINASCTGTTKSELLLDS